MYVGVIITEPKKIQMDVYRSYCLTRLTTHNSSYTYTLPLPMAA